MDGWMDGAPLVLVIACLSMLLSESAMIGSMDDAMRARERGPLVSFVLQHDVSPFIDDAEVMCCGAQLVTSNK